MNRYGIMAPKTAQEPEDEQENAPVDAPEDTPAPETPAVEPNDSGEEHENEAKTGLFGRLFARADKRKADKLEADASVLRADLSRAEAENARLHAENAGLQAQVDQFNAEWPAIEAALISGDEDSEALKSAFGVRVTLAVSKAITSAAARSGRAAGRLPGKLADAPDTGKPGFAGDPKSVAGLSAQVRQTWASSGYTPPGLN